MYVVEAGRGGSGPSVFLRGALQKYGSPGALTRLGRGTQERVATVLPSMIDASGQVFGAHDVSFQGRGSAYVTVGFGADPALRAGFGPAGSLFGTLLHVPASGKWRAVADISAYEAVVNPAGGPVDSNPYGVLATPGAHLVADAGANALLRVGTNGDISTLAVFPSRPARLTDSVPTSVVEGPDGAYYVGELTGAPVREPFPAFAGACAGCGLLATNAARSDPPFASRHRPTRHAVRIAVPESFDALRL